MRWNASPVIFWNLENNKQTLENPCRDAISPRSAVRIRVMQAQSGACGLLPLDTLDLLEQERGVPVQVDRIARLDWIDQAQSTNLWLADPDARTASFLYREAWERGLKTTYYLRTLNKSTIDNAHRDRRPVTEKREFTEGEKAACSIDSIRNGTCEACQ